MDELLNLYWPGVTSALWNTIALIAISIALSSVLGVLIGLGLQFLPRWASLPLRIYVDFVRGVPALVLIFASYYMLGFLLQTVGISLSTFGAAVVALTVSGAADMAEISRGAIGTIPKGQTEAGRASGLTGTDIFFGILARQALVQAAPPWSNSATELVKGSTLLSLVGLNELVKETGTIVATNGNALFYYVAVALVFVLINLTVQGLAIATERTVDYPRA